MRQMIAFVVLGSILVALVVLVGTAEAREDELARSIARLVETAR